MVDTKDPKKSVNNKPLKENQIEDPALMVERNPQRIRRIDAARALPEVKAQIRQVVSDYLDSAHAAD